MLPGAVVTVCSEQPTLEPSAIASPRSLAPAEPSGSCSMLNCPGASGTLPGNRAFETPAELKIILAEKREAFCRCLVEKLLTYALGRGLQRYDRPAVEGICAGVAENGYRFSELAVRIAESDPFTMRRGDGGEQ